MVLIDLVFHAVKCVHETFAVQRATCKLMFLINTGCVPTSQPRPLHPLLWISERSSIASVEVFLCTMFSLCSNMGGMVGAVITMKNCTTHQPPCSVLLSLLSMQHSISCFVSIICFMRATRMVAIHPQSASTTHITLSMLADGANQPSVIHSQTLR